MKRLLLCMAAAAACGEGGSSIVDAPTIDTSMSDCGCVGDAPDPIARVHVFDDTGAVAGTQVIFQSAAGALVADTTTGANGIAQAPVEAGAVVTAIDSTQGTLHTWVGVRPGDVLELYRPSADFMDATLTVPARGSNRHYEVSTSCGDRVFYDEQATVGATVTFTASLRLCRPRLDFYVYSDNGDGGGFATFFARDVAVAAAQPIALTGAYQGLVDVTQSFTNLGTTHPAIDVGRLVNAGGGRMFETSQPVAVVGDAASGVLTMPAVPPGFFTAVFAMFSSEAGLSQRMVFEAQPPAQYTLDAAGLFLPAFTALPQFDTATQQVTWSETATGAAPDFSVTTVFISRPSTKSSWEWFIAAPHAAAAITLPSLPGGDWNPVATDSTFVSQVFTVRAPGGWDAARPVVAAVESPEQLTGGGRVVLERSLQPTLDRQVFTATPRPRRR